MRRVEVTWCAIVVDAVVYTIYCDTASRRHDDDTTFIQSFLASI